MHILKKTIAILVTVVLLLLAVIPTVAVAPQEKTPDFAFHTDTLLLVNMDTDEVYFSQNADKERVMASTTKIMTYIVIAETVDDLVNTKITIEQEPIDHIMDRGASTAGFENHVGQSYSVLDVLYGLMLPSGCDAAEVLAYYAGDGDVQKFVDMMNAKAQELHCTHTHFNDAHGLSNENHYTTAEDLYTITKYALTMPYFEEMVRTEYYTLPGDTAPLINTNYLVDTINGRQYYYPYATGIKTGYTSLAGRCLVSTATKGDTNLMCIALGGKYDAESNYVNYAMVDSVNLYKWAFENFTDNIDIALDSAYKSVQIGKQVRLQAEITKSNINAAPEIQWESLNPDVATVDENGVVTALSLGEARIRAETQTGNFAICNVACGYYNGIDVSSRCGDYTSGEKQPIDWAAVKKAGFDFAIIRAGWGRENYPNQNDATFVENVRAAAANDIKIGLSFVAYATDAEAAKQEAEYLLREIREYIPEYRDLIALPILYNMTDSRFRGFTAEQNTDIALAFNQAMRENGYQTMCYTGVAIFRNMDAGKLKSADMGLAYVCHPWQFDFSEKVMVNDAYVPELWEYRSDGYFPEASENLNTKMHILYMVSAECAAYQAPTVTARQVTDQQAVEITWENVPYAISGFSVYRKAAGSEQLEKIADVDSNVLQYTDTDVQGNDSFAYFVAAKATDRLDKTYFQEILSAGTPAVTIVLPSTEAPKPSAPADDNQNTKPAEPTVPPAESTDASNAPLHTATPDIPKTGSPFTTVIWFVACTTAAASTTMGVSRRKKRM